MRFFDELMGQRFFARQAQGLTLPVNVCSLGTATIHPLVAGFLAHQSSWTGSEFR